MKQAAAWSTLAVVLCGMFAGALGIGYMLGISEPAEITAAPSQRVTPVVRVVQDTAPAVVNISTDTVVNTHPFLRGRGDLQDFFSRFMEIEPRRRVVPNSLGSGVLVSPEGHVLTNSHVLTRANRIRVTLADGTELEAEVVGADPTSDLAVLELEGEGPFPSAPLGSSDDLLIGETVVAIGNPFGLSHSVTTGVVSALNRSVRGMDETVYSDFIQTDASINPGNSGGPLLNIRGEVVGINTAIRPGAEGIGFAIPIDRARRVLDDLINFGQVRPLWLGMHVRELTPRLARRLHLEPGGVVVQRVYDGSPADRAGIEPLDRIVTAEEVDIPNLSAWRTFLGRHGPGEELTLDLERGDEVTRAYLTLEALDQEQVLELVRMRVGLILEEPTPQERARGVPADVLVVREVIPGSAAHRQRFRPGDWIAAVNNRRVTSLADFVDEFSALWDRNALILQAARRGTLYRIPLEMD